MNPERNAVATLVTFPLMIRFPALLLLQKKPNVKSDFVKKVAIVTSRESLDKIMDAMPFFYIARSIELPNNAVVDFPTDKVL